jgi:DNA-binding NtrC family response regulator
MPVAIHDPFTAPNPGPVDSWLAAVLLGDHPLMAKVRTLVVQAAKSDLPVLITGETGTGKDITARAIHCGSPRGAKKLYVVPLAGLRETAWSVLFGHKQGAFTGSTADHEGIFGAASDSTIVFDDIDIASLELQPMLLRSVQHGAYRRLGEIEERRSNARILATSNVSLDREIANGRFRADLYQRISVLRIKLPPLREHIDDLACYVPHFLRKVTGPGHAVKSVSRDGMKVLRRYHWPRNVRELEHLLYRASVEIIGPALGADDVSYLLKTEPVAPEEDRRPSKRSLDRSEVEAALCGSQGNKREAARRLGIAPGTLYKLIKQYGLDSPPENHLKTERRSL